MRVECTCSSACNNVRLCGDGYGGTGVPHGISLGYGYGGCRGTEGTLLGQDCVTDAPTTAPTLSPTSDMPTVSPTTEAPTDAPTADPLPVCYEALRVDSTFCCLREHLHVELLRKLCEHHNQGKDVPDWGDGGDDLLFLKEG